MIHMDGDHKKAHIGKGIQSISHTIEGRISVICGGTLDRWGFVLV